MDENENPNVGREVEYTVGPQEQPDQGKPPEDKRGFWQRNGGTLITLAILGLVIGGAIAVNERRGDDLDLNSGPATKETEQPQDQDMTMIDEGDQDDKSGETKLEPKPGGEVGSGTSDARILPASGDELIEIANSSIQVTAKRGEGRTHLARRAITEQLKKTDSSLSPEARVYAEDYLQKKYAPKVALHPGSTITFTLDQVNEAVSAAQSLTPGQLRNLHQWAVLVNFPP